MPIPAFDAILNVLPPHLGDPRVATDLSPYRCTMPEVCDRFTTTPKRKEILEGLLNLRAELLAIDVMGFQWLGGSFVEDIEAQEGRDPGDIDVITFASHPSDLPSLKTKFDSKPELLSRSHVKTTYRIDHFLLPLCSAPTHVVEQTRYWCGLFSHRRDRLWKGMLVVDLADKGIDDAARAVLGGKP